MSRFQLIRRARVIGTALGSGGTLSAPHIDYPTASNPTSIAIHLGQDWQSGDVLKLARSASATMSNATILSHTLTDADIAAGTLAIGLSALTLSGITYFQALGNDGTIDSQFLSNIVAWGDAVAPTITNSKVAGSSGQTFETLQLWRPLTYSDAGGVPSIISDGTTPGWYIDSGPDQLQFEIAVVAGVIGYRWFGDGSRSFLTPADIGADNLYDFTVGAIDYAGNKTTKALQEQVLQVDLVPDAFSFASISGAARSTNIIAAETITVSGIQPGFSAPVSTAGGLFYSKNGGTYTTASGTVANGDTINVSEPSSANYSTNTVGTLTIGTVSANFSVITMANPTAVDTIPSSNQPARSTTSGTSHTFTGIDFSDGYGVVYLGALGGSISASSVTIGGAACTKMATAAGEQSLWVSNAPIAAGNLDVVATAGGTGTSWAVMCGTLINTANPTPTSTAVRSNDVSTGRTIATATPLTIPTNGIGVAFSGWVLTYSPSSGRVLTTGLGGAGRITANYTAGSWTPTFTSTSDGFGEIIAAAWGP